MLTASLGDMEGLEMSKALPNARHMPKPNNWSGVLAGLERAKHAIESKDLNGAEQHLREILEFAPAQAEAWHILAAVLNRKGEKSEARDCLRRMQKLTHKPDITLPVSQRMAKLLWAQDDRQAAMHMLAELSLAAPDDETLIALQQQWSEAI